MGEKSPDWKTVKFDLSAEWYDQLTKWKRDLKCGTMSELFRYIIRDFLESRRSGKTAK